MRRFSLRHAFCGASIIVFSFAFFAQHAYAVPSGVVTLDTSNTVTSGTNVAITNATNPTYNSANGSESGAAVTYQGAGNADISLNNLTTIAASGNNFGLVVFGNNQHGAGDVTTAVDFYGAAAGSGSGGGVYFSSTGMYNSFNLEAFANLLSGSSGVAPALLVTSTHGMSLNIQGVISGNYGMAGIQSDATNSGNINISVTGVGIIDSTSGSAIYIPAGASAFNTQITLNGGDTISASGTSPTVLLSHVASGSGDVINIYAASNVLSSNAGTSAIDVSGVTGAPTTINIDGGYVKNLGGGTAIYLGQTNDTVNITYGTITGGIQTAQNGAGIVNINTIPDFTVNGDIGTASHRLASINITESPIGAMELNTAFYAQNITLNSGTLHVGVSGAMLNTNQLTFAGTTLNLDVNTLMTGTTTLQTANANSTIDVGLGAHANGMITGTLTNNLAAGGKTIVITPVADGHTLAVGDQFVVFNGMTNLAGLSVANNGGILAPYWTLESGITGNDAYGNAINGNSVVLAYNQTHPTVISNVTANSSNALVAAITSNAPAQITAAVENLTTTQQLSQAGAKLGAESNRGSIAGTQSSVDGVLGTVADRLDALRNAHGISGFSTGENPQGIGFWAQGFGNGASQDSNAGAGGYDLIGGGIAFGGDKAFTKNIRAGAAFAYAHTQVNDTGDNAGNQDKINSYLGTLYATYQGEPWYADTAFDFGYHHYATQRVVDFTGFYDVANGQHDGYQYTMKVNGGYPIALEPVTLTPTLGFNYTHLNQTGYTETSVSGSALNIGSLSDDSFRSSLGGKISKTFEAPDYTITPQLSASWVHEYLNTHLQSNVAYAEGGSAFTTVETSPIENSALLGISTAIATKDDMKLVASYSAELSEGYISHTGILQLRKDF